MNAVLTPKDFATSQEVRWCPGCGDYAILKAVQKALGEQVPAIIEENRRDLSAGEKKGLSRALLDRLRLDVPGPTVACTKVPHQST